MDSSTIVKGVRSMPITEALYALKDHGSHPMATVNADTDGRVRQVVLSIDGIEYYFHSTKDRNGDYLSVEEEEYEHGTVYTVPFDGWGAAPDRLGPVH